MITSAHIRLLPVAAVTAALALSPASASAAAIPKGCKKQPHTIAKRYGNPVFRKAHSLWACTQWYTDPPRTVRLGRWDKSSKVSWDGITAIWTLPSSSVAPDGSREDRLWAVDATRYVRILKDTRPYLAAPHSALDGKVVGLKASGLGVGWVTAGGLVGTSLESPASDPVAIGGGTAAAALPPVDTFAQGLVAAFTPDDDRLIVGRWSADPSALASSLKVENTDGDGDECGGRSYYDITVEPIAGQPRVGVQWDSYWLSSSLACSGE